MPLMVVLPADCCKMYHLFTKSTKTLSFVYRLINHTSVNTHQETLVSFVVQISYLHYMVSKVGVH